LLWVLDLQDLGAKIGELRGDRVTGNQPRQVDDPDTVERAGGVRGKRLLRQAHRRGGSSTRRRPLAAAAIEGNRPTPVGYAREGRGPDNVARRLSGLLLASK